MIHRWVGRILAVVVVAALVAWVLAVGPWAVWASLAVAVALALGVAYAVASTEAEDK